MQGCRHDARPSPRWWPHRTDELHGCNTCAGAQDCVAIGQCSGFENIAPHVPIDVGARAART
eukprot:1643730-Alexandrium_andersonii.AAC.1